MTVSIDSRNMPDLELFPEDETKDIIQNILCILKTTQGSCPGFREYGLDPEILHKPVQVAKAAFSVSIKAQMDEFEPRAILSKIEFADDPNNPTALNPILEVMIQ